MKKITDIKIIFILLIAINLWGCDKNTDYAVGHMTDVEGYYPFTTNVGALVNNKYPHSGEIFQTQLNYYSKTPVKKITFWGKVVHGTSSLSSALRYTDMVLLEELDQDQIAALSGFSEEDQVDTIIFNWYLPEEFENDASYVYYQYAVEATNGLADTTSGDYWKVRAKSSTATLEDLYLDSEMVNNFDADTYEYSLVLKENEGIPVVTASPSSLSISSLQIKQATNLTGSLEERTATVTVIAEDEETIKVYSVVFSVSGSES